MSSLGAVEIGGGDGELGEARVDAASARPSGCDSK